MRSPQLFQTDVARFCLSSPDSRIEQTFTGLRVYEEPACGAELKKIARAWDRVRSAVGVHVERSRQGRVKKALEEEFKGGAQYLYETKACPCLVFKGPRAREMSEAAQSITVER